ncbi:MAG: phosphoribosyltransferase family protein, partial [Flammeovirgaceae bacterium]|nr:phosphoribosyltransferase family protein [Flammeovirgaceae bacterium]
VMREWLDDFVSLFYPKSCFVCQRSLNTQEKLICLHCQAKLPCCNYHLDSTNPIVKKFWGRLPIEFASAFLKFSKGNATQQLLHALKYEGEEEIGDWLGKMYGTILAKCAFISRFDAVIPVPLHPQKEKIRGYNQCNGFARQLALALKAEALLNTVKRTVFTVSQTKQSRLGRFANVSNIFQVAEPLKLQGKHVLLVDDVITTGATVEACGNVVLQNGAKKLSVVAIAFAE